jgi:hypothetical protein
MVEGLLKDRSSKAAAAGFKAKCQLQNKRQAEQQYDE